MIAYVTSIGETTTELCVWSLERQGFEVRLIQDRSSLWDKLKRIFSEADNDFLRVDADVVVNRNVNELIKQNELVWYQAKTFGWFSQDVINGGIQFVRKEAINTVNSHINEAMFLHRPESYLYRLKEFHEPRVCGTFDKVCGIHGYKQIDKDRVKQVKAERGQLANYDFELAERLEEL